MLKCPFCHFENEDGALFCEQCKSDLAGVEAAAARPADAVPVVEAVPLEVAPAAAPMVAEATPLAAEAAPLIAEAVPLPPDGVPVVAEAVPLATVSEAAVVAEALAPVAPAGPVPMAPDVPPLTLEPIPSPLAPPAVEAAPVVPPIAEEPPEAAAPTVSTSPAPTAPATTAPLAAAPAAGEPGTLPAGAQPRLLVMRGLKRNVEYPVYEGQNYVGRADEKPVDIDLEDQEPPDRIWSSRQHAVIILENDKMVIEDLNSSNGTFVNRVRIYPGQPRPLSVNDVIQIGTVQLKVIV